LKIDTKRLTKQLRQHVQKPNKELVENL